MKTQNKLISVVIIAFFMGLILGLFILSIQNNDIKKDKEIIIEEQPPIRIINQIQQDSFDSGICYDSYNPVKKELKHAHYLTGNKLPN